MEFQIADKTIGNDHPVFFIAEAGVNHNGSIDLAKELIDIAVEAEVDAVKFQTFKAEEMITKDAPKADYHIQTTGHDNQQTWYDLLKTQEISFEMHEELISYCETKGIIFMSTPYSLQGVDLLNNLGTPAFKVSSSDITNFPLLEHITKIGKPIIISTGASELEEVQSAVELFVKINFKTLFFSSVLQTILRCWRILISELCNHTARSSGVCTDILIILTAWLTRLPQLPWVPAFLRNILPLTRNFPGPPSYVDGSSRIKAKCSCRQEY